MPRLRHGSSTVDVATAEDTLYVDSGRLTDDGATLISIEPSVTYGSGVTPTHLAEHNPHGRMRLPLNEAKPRDRTSQPTGVHHGSDPSTATIPAASLSRMPMAAYPVPLI
jgi:hypothetical protein